LLPLSNPNFLYQLFAIMLVNLPAFERQVIRGQTESPTKSFSHVFPFNQEQVTKVTKTLSSETAPVFRAVVYTDMVKQHLGVNNKGQFFILTCPVLNLDDPNSPTYGASASDIIGKSVPIQFCAEDFFATFTSLVRANDATLLHLPQASEMPDTIPGPGTGEN
jgi:hypothetical protein